MHNSHSPVEDSLPAPARRSRRLSRRTRLIVAGASLVLLGAGAFITVPNLLSANLNANESAVIATLKNISSAQAQCQASGRIDVNGNGQGEYGFLGELSGHVPVRGASHRIAPPVLSSSFADVHDSRVSKSGYVIQLFLPAAHDRGVAEDGSGGDPDNDNGVVASQAEVLWCCYAWPLDYGWSGKRTFFINQGGDVLATNGAQRTYDGAEHPCPFAAAFAASAEPVMGSPIAANTVAQDGNFWVVV